MFSYSRSSSTQREYTRLDFLRACPAPKPEKGNRNVVTCAFITVNPSSDNIAATLDYITTLSEHLSQQRDSLILADKSTYTDTSYMSDLYEIYSNGKICFNVSSEIVFDDYIRYCSGEITLEQLITEADRIPQRIKPL